MNPFESSRSNTSVSRATLWSWAPSQPKNYSGDSDSSSESLFRCASTSPTGWAVTDCSTKLYAACRATNPSISSPYDWAINTYPISYSFAPQACPDRYSFAVPRTALENSYLNKAIRDTRRDYDGRGVWIDWNTLNVRDCWVSGGPNATCGYTDTVTQADDLRKKTVLVGIKFHPVSLVPCLILDIGTKLTLVLGAFLSSTNRFGHHNHDCLCQDSGE